ncbi:MAG: T9SS C-terminal target domain-containing protein [Bacteroidetes bacterium]|nr:MAG: T9SS C-terminal target domain-containing protein [Bacteroidota bacterium]
MSPFTIRLALFQLYSWRLPMCPRRLSGPIPFLFLLGMVLGTLPAPASAQTLTSHVFAAAGGTTENAMYRLSATLGEPIAGHAVSASGMVYAGFWATARMPATTGTAVDSAGDLPADYRLDANYPNPFNPQTTIRYGLPQTAPVRLVVYDVLGRPVRVLVDGVQQAGWHTVRFEANHLSSGVYIYRLEAPGVQRTGSMVLLR